LKCIDYRAFENCESLKTVFLPDGIEEIHVFAFKYCSGLKVIRLPQSLADDGTGSNPERGISINAFIGCPQDMLIIGEEGEGKFGAKAADYFDYRFESEYRLNRYQEFYATETGGIIANDDVVMEYTDTYEFPSAYHTTDGDFVPLTRLTTGHTVNARCVIMPDFLEEIATASFADVQCIETVRMNSVRSIGTMSFWNCRDLVDIELPDGLVRIDDSAFEDCVSLTNVVLPESLESIGDSAFLDCVSITEIRIPSLLVWLPDGCFGRTSITEITIPANITCVGASFFECEKLQSVVAEEGVRVFEASFYGCTSLKSVVLPSSMEWMSQMTFAGCTELEDVWIYSMDANFEYYDLFYVRDLYDYDRESNIITDFEDLVLESVKDESRHIFTDCPNVTIHAYPGSTAEAYAKKHGLRFEAIETETDISPIDVFINR